MDESDKLFEMGFVEQIDSVVAACTNPKIIRALFSATLPDTVEELARSIMHDAVRVTIGERYKHFGQFRLSYYLVFCRFTVAVVDYVIVFLSVIVS